ncbi:hypothetical protein [Corallococcus sp. AB030]|uniref:P-loop ATPase, Sll1717 family n=1 Tax=Corallococcus sp. AB030 TaxID=2316716 RepID=UPI0011E5D856|nr:hypothetical protein [Corallococcus sp. AB030]
MAKVTGEFREKSQNIRCILFIRDNMLRALAEFDGDYTRNIENSILRLQWNEEMLLDMVALRLRAVLKLGGEQNIRIWNRFAERGLEGKPGFRRCLQLTLYRPRDVIALLNHAYQDADRAERKRIIEEDIEAAATRISRARLNDLYKEYERVLPGLTLFGDAFKGAPGRSSYSTIKARLDEVAAATHSGPEARDFALLSTGAEAFNALYSVGFVGVQEPDGVSVRFCHDGSNVNVQELSPDAVVVVHPCYWRALDLKDVGAEVLVRVDDEDDVAITKTAKDDMQELRLRKLGRVVEDLQKIPEGHAGAHAFEEWVLTTARYLFSKGLDNVQRNPNSDALQRRDIVGTNRGEFGFWKRLERTYGVSQFIIECKNYDPVSQDEFRQAWGYLKGPYGRLLMMVTRSNGEALSESERGLVMEGYQDNPSKMIFVMPAFLLARAISKMRSGKEGRDDWVDKQLCDRLDVFERVYVSLRSRRSK